MSLNVDRSQNDTLNLQVLQRRDAQISEILATASHVVIYEFDEPKQEWKRSEVEGCLFVVKRFSSPRFQVVVNNRLNTDNFVISLTPEVELNDIDQFLILRVPSEAGWNIYGAWFYPEEDRATITTLVKKVIGALRRVGSSASPARAAPPTAERAEAKQVAVKEKTAAPPVSVEGKQAGAAILGMIGQTTQSHAPPPAIQRSDSTTSATSSSSTQSQGTQPSLMKRKSSSSTLLVPMSVAAAAARTKASSGSPSPVNANGKTNGILMRPRSATPKRQSPKHAQPMEQITAQVNEMQVSPAVEKAALKETLISLLDDDAFLDKIYQTYTRRLSAKK